MRIGVLGPMLVTNPHGSTVRVGVGKQLTLLAHLVCQRPAPLSVDTIVDILWSTRPPSSARQNVHLYIHRLRRALGENIITSAGFGYVLTDQDGLVDADEFERHAERGRNSLANGHLETARYEFRAAMELWRGTPYHGIEPTLGVAEEVARLEEIQLALLEQYHDAELAMGRHAELVPELMTLAERHPLRERFTAQLMVALHRSGRTGDALDAYRTTYEALTGQLGLDPTSELRDLEQAVLTDDPALLTTWSTVRVSPQRGAAVSSSPASTALAPPSAAEALVPAELPRDLADFTGRDSEVSSLLRDLDGNRSTVLAISGLGGVGKTSLAVHVAHAKAAEYADGQLYADLHGTDAEPPNAGHILHRFLRSLGVADEAVPASTAERANLYRSILAQRRMIVVLDNAASEQQIRLLLPGTSACGVLVTSRSALVGLEGTNHVDLDVFRPDEATSLLEHIVGTEAVRDDPESAAQIADLCGYVPLAIRIAGARIARRPHWTMAEMARLLDDERGRLDQLSAGDLEVRSSFALSYRLLPEETQRAFRLLGAMNVPTFPWWVPAALLDIAPDDGRVHIDTLVDINLLSVAGTDATGEHRYRIHNLVALYANERSTTADSHGERTAAFRRVAGGLLHILEQAAAATPGPCYATLHGTASRWVLPQRYVDAVCRQPIRWFDSEADTVIDVIQFACRHDEDEIAWELAACLERYFDVRARTVDWRRTNAMALSACVKAENVLGEAVLRRGMAELDAWANPDRTAMTMLDLHEHGRHIYELFERAHEPRGMADALVMITWSRISQSQIEAATEAAQESLSLATTLGYLGGQARARQVLGVAAHYAGHTDEARDHLLSALQLARRLENVRFEITAMQFLGAIEVVLGKLDDAHEHLSLSLAMARSIPDPYAEVFSLLYLGRLYARPQHQGRRPQDTFPVYDSAKARSVVQRALSMSRRYGFSHHAADALTLLGELELTNGDPRAAVGLLEEAITLWNARGWQSFLDNAEILLARAREAAAQRAELKA
jgi:DNA-binding SARP family transcriptional activator/tetratricopeptide (TPR) repeat protein